MPEKELVIADSARTVELIAFLGKEFFTLMGKLLDIVDRQTSLVDKQTSLLSAMIVKLSEK
jgi:hypothetical protein